MEVFDNQNFFMKQKRVDGSGLPPGLVDIDRVNADELDATSDQIARCILGQVGMMLEVFLGCPVLVPTAMHEDSSPSQLLALEEAGING